MMPRKTPPRFVALALVTVLALAAPALAHGAPTVEQKDVEHLRVTYFTFEELFQREWARLGFAAEDRNMGTEVSLDGSEVLFEFLDADGGVAHEQRVPLEAGEDRWNADVFIENAHALRATLDVDEVTVTFDQAITQGTEGGAPPMDANADDATGSTSNDTPAPGALVVIVLAGAVALTARGARR